MKKKHILILSTTISALLLGACSNSETTDTDCVENKMSDVSFSCVDKSEKIKKNYDSAFSSGIALLEEVQALGYNVQTVQLDSYKYNNEANDMNFEAFGILDLDKETGKVLGYQLTYKQPNNQKDIESILVNNFLITNNNDDHKYELFNLKEITTLYEDMYGLTIANSYYDNINGIFNALDTVGQEEYSYNEKTKQHILKVKVSDSEYNIVFNEKLEMVNYNAKLENNRDGGYDIYEYQYSGHNQVMMNFNKEVKKLYNNNQDKIKEIDFIEEEVATIFFEAFNKLSSNNSSIHTTELNGQKYKIELINNEESEFPTIKIGDNFTYDIAEDVIKYNSKEYNLESFDKEAQDKEATNLKKLVVDFLNYQLSFSYISEMSNDLSNFSYYLDYLSETEKENLIITFNANKSFSKYYINLKEKSIIKYETNNLTYTISSN